MHATKMVHETYWGSSSIACQEKGTDWILRIFTFNDKNPSYLLIIFKIMLQFFWRSKWSRSNPVSHKIIWHIPNIKKSEFKIKKCHVFSNLLSFFIYFFRQYLWDQSPSLHYQCCLQVSETFSWDKLRRCYPANILHHQVGMKCLVYFCRVVYSRISRSFSEIELVSVIFVRYCRYPVSA